MIIRIIIDTDDGNRLSIRDEITKAEFEVSVYKPKALVRLRLQDMVDKVVEDVK